MGLIFVGEFALSVSWYSALQAPQSFFGLLFPPRKSDWCASEKGQEIEVSNVISEPALCFTEYSTLLTWSVSRLRWNALTCSD